MEPRSRLVKEVWSKSVVVKRREGIIAAYNVLEG